MPTVSMQAPTTWPFNSPVVPASRMPSGNAYRPDANGQILAQQNDVGALVGYGFSQVGRGSIPTVRSVTITSDTLSSSDNGGAVRYTSGSTITVTVPSGLGTGFNCLLIQAGAGVITPTAGSGVEIENRQSHTTSAGENAMISLFADTANHIILSGDTA